MHQFQHRVTVFLILLCFLSVTIQSHLVSPSSLVISSSYHSSPFFRSNFLSFQQKVSAVLDRRRAVPITTMSSSVSKETTAKGYQEQKKKGRINRQLVTFLSGGLAGTIASTLTMPLEVIKTQLQASSGGVNKKATKIFSQILQKDGPFGFFRGLTPMLIGIIPTRAVYFWAYSTTKEFLKQTSIGDSSLNHLISAFSAGITSNTLTNPIWMIKTRFQILGDHRVGQKIYSGYREVIQSIWREEGIHGFFKGLTASYIGCFEGAIQWIVYEKLKTSVLSSSILESFSGNANGRDPSIPPPKPSMLDLFLMASFSKFTAICLTYPHEVVRTRLREQSINGLFKYSGFFSALKKIAVEEGARGLYSGLGMHLIRSVPNAAIMFVSYEVVSSWLDKQTQKDDQK